MQWCNTPTCTCNASQVHTPPSQPNVLPSHILPSQGPWGAQNTQDLSFLMSDSQFLLSVVLSHCNTIKWGCHSSNHDSCSLYFVIISKSLRYIGAIKQLLHIWVIELNLFQLVFPNIWSCSFTEPTLHAAVGTWLAVNQNTICTIAWKWWMASCSHT